MPMTPKLKVEVVPIETIKPYEHNAKLHPAEQVEQIARSIDSFGFNDPIAVDGDGTIIEGHGRLLAAQALHMDKVPIIRLTHLDDDARRAYILAHNKLTMNSGFDMDTLAAELDSIFDIDMSEFGFDDILDDIDDIDDTDDTEPVIMEDEAPQRAPERVKLGDVWQLGNHRLMCGDCTDADSVAVLMDGATADLVFTDPPYGMGKEREGILNDNLNATDLLAFNKRWIPLTFEHLSDVGSWYCWGVDEPLMDIYGEIIKPMAERGAVTFRNLITWDKTFAQGQLSDVCRSYTVASEKCLFVMCGVQGFNDNADHYFEGWEPLRAYLAGEAERVGLNASKLKEICGVVSMFSHWFTRSQFCFITEDHYKELQAYYGGKAFTREYDDLKREYDDLKRSYYDSRAYFDNTHDNMNDVWHFTRTSGAERAEAGGHASPKPVALCARAIKSSSRTGDLVLDVFGGSGSTLIAAEQCGRTCYMMELDPHYCDIILARWEKLTGGTAERLTD